MIMNNKLMMSDKLLYNLQHIMKKVIIPNMTKDMLYIMFKQLKLVTYKEVTIWNIPFVKYTLCYAIADVLSS